MIGGINMGDHYDDCAHCNAPEGESHKNVCPYCGDCGGYHMGYKHPTCPLKPKDEE